MENLGADEILFKFSGFLFQPFINREIELTQILHCDI